MSWAIIAMSRPTQTNRAAMLVAAGGYERIEMALEAIPAAAWSDARRMTAYALAYRLAGKGWWNRLPAPLQDEPMTTARLAAEAGMSERSFFRRYRDATGWTPGRAVERLRVEAARQMLAETGLSFKRIARQCGFGTAETMRRSFLRVQGVGPQAFRARFGV